VSEAHGNFIGGRWVPAASGRTTENRNPPIRRPDRDPRSGPADVEKAVAAARKRSQLARAAGA
jgi:acyl-CoA reductase-like NAD-dependent aldehyde dehydrogenase